MTELLNTLELEVECLKEKNSNLYKRFKNSERSRLRLKNQLRKLQIYIDKNLKQINESNDETQNISNDNDTNNHTNNDTNNSQLELNINLDDDWEKL